LTAPRQHFLSPRPRATYRLQFSKTFGFDDARRIVPYLAHLGISHVYASPLLKARPGSTHGYDIVDHNRLNPEIGGLVKFDALVGELRRHGMGLILDFVPNHMGVGPDNPWWVDILEWGRASPYAEYFDIDWEPLEPTLNGKVLLPVLGDHYGLVLERGELQVRFKAAEGSFAITYWDNTFPVSPYGCLGLLEATAQHSSAVAQALAPILGDLRDCLRGRRDRSATKTQRQRVSELKRRLAALVAEDKVAKQAIFDAVHDVNGRAGERESFDALHRLLERQPYRLAYWRVAAHEINYRRFFDINDLASLRMEQPALFEASHGLIRRFLVDDKIQGLRLDHVDGLRDPKEYFERLQRLAASSRGDVKPSGLADGRGQAEDGRPLYVLVEKILAPHESLRADWAVSGTTGYEFMADVNGLFVNPAAERALTRLYNRVLGTTSDFEEMVIAAKQQIMHETLASELNVLANNFHRLAKQSRNTRDFSHMGLREALAGIVAHFPVYRTYATAEGVGNEDRRDLNWAVGKARRRARTPGTLIYDFVQAVLTLDLLKSRRTYRRRDIIDAALKFQQYTGPVMAKAMEDTTFYRYVRLVSLNEVGGEPSRFGTSPSAFHEVNRQRLRVHPDSMLSTATHDHKRGEDVRARLNVLSEVPRDWGRRVQRWMQLNKRKLSEVDGQTAPSPNDQYLFYQTVVGAWPYSLTAPDFQGIEQFRKRIAAYMLKAVREAKRHTSWSAQNQDYEAALLEFVARSLDPKQSEPFIQDIHHFVELIAPAGAVNGLAQVLLRLVSPGVPDTYQGTELWDFSLVDPDNRRPVNYEGRQTYLTSIRSASCAELLGAWRDGRIKLYTICRALEVRRRLPALFAEGDYQALEATGPQAENLVALARCHDGRRLIAVAPRFVASRLENQNLPLPQGWTATRLAVPPEIFEDGPLVDALTGTEAMVDLEGHLPVERILSEFPVALLVSPSR